MLKIICLLVGLSLSCISWANANFQKLVSTAENAYDGGDFEQAAALYQQAIDAGLVNGHVYYNLGNSLYRLGRKGDAMAAFLRARDFLPRDPDVAANLKFLSDAATDNLKPVREKRVWQWIFFWCEHITLKDQALAFGVSFGLACLLFIPTLFWRRWVWLRYFCLGFWVVSLLLGAGLGLHIQYRPTWGAVRVDAAQVFSGPNPETDTVLFELHELAPIIVTDRRPGWVKIEVSGSEKKGWLKGSEVAVF